MEMWFKYSNYVGVGCFCRTIQPVILGYFISYFDPTTSVTQGAAYGYAFGVVILSLLGICFMHHCCFAEMRIGMRCRIACCSLVYRKVLIKNPKFWWWAKFSYLFECGKNWNWWYFSCSVWTIHHLPKQRPAKWSTCYRTMWADSTWPPCTCTSSG